jgi:hypothetical protein
MPWLLELLKNMEASWSTYLRSYHHNTWETGKHESPERKACFSTSRTRDLLNTKQKCRLWSGFRFIWRWRPQTLFDLNLRRILPVEIISAEQRTEKLRKRNWQISTKGNAQSTLTVLLFVFAKVKGVTKRTFSSTKTNFPSVYTEQCSVFMFLG